MKKKYVELPKPADIPTYIEAYFQYKYKKNSDAKVLIDNLESLLDSVDSESVKQYLLLYYGTVYDVADSLDELEKRRASLESEVESWYKKEISKISDDIPKKKKEVEKALSYGLEAVLSYYITQSLINYLPPEISNEATGGVMFVSFLGLMFLVDTYYRRKKSKLFKKRENELNNIKEWYTSRKRELFKRGETRAELYWKEHIEGKNVKDTVDYVSKQDGTHPGLIGMIISKIKNPEE